MARSTPIERFMAKVDKSGDCWLWIGPLDRYGYGKFFVEGRTVLTHRWVYTALAGPIPDGLTLDHLCHSRVAQECAALSGVCTHRRCVNPDHLEPVTALVNVARGTAWLVTECPHGHEYTAENTWVDGRGFRNCRTCRRKRSTEWARRSRQRARAS